MVTIINNIKNINIGYKNKLNVDFKYFIDYDKMRELALECKPKMIIAGASAYARTIDFKRFREVADKVGAVLMVDMALFTTISLLAGVVLDISYGFIDPRIRMGGGKNNELS